VGRGRVQRDLGSYVIHVPCLQDSVVLSAKEGGQGETAKQFGLTIPQSVLYQADKVIK